MAPSRLLAQNVRPKRFAEEDFDEDEELDGSIAEADSDDEEDDGVSVSGDERAEDGEEDDVGAGEEDELEDREGDPEQYIATVSFGALKKANEELSRKRKRDSDVTDGQEDKVEALRKRLRQIKEEKARDGPTINRKAGSKPGLTSIITNDDSGQDSDSDSAPSAEDAPSTSRTSKHAPAAQSTKHQVTRKRTVVDVPKRVIRDPRFDALQQRSAHTGSNTEKAYSFLTDYQKSEISELKAAIKKTTDEDEKILLRRKANSMENRLKSQAAKEREQTVLRDFRKEEKGKVEQGKTPFYLKKKDVKERALVEKFKGMKGKEREKIVERRRKKEGQKEKRMMPRDRRVAG